MGCECSGEKRRRHDLKWIGQRVLCAFSARSSFLDTSGDSGDGRTHQTHEYEIFLSLICLDCCFAVGLGNTFSGHGATTTTHARTHARSAYTNSRYAWTGRAKRSQNNIYYYYGTYISPDIDVTRPIYRLGCTRGVKFSFTFQHFERNSRCIVNVCCSLFRYHANTMEYPTCNCENQYTHSSPTHQATVDVVVVAIHATL